MFTLEISSFLLQKTHPEFSIECAKLLLCVGLMVLECKTAVDLPDRPSRQPFPDLLRHHREMNCRIKEQMRWERIIQLALPCSEQYQQQQAAQDCVQLGFEYL